MVYTNKYKNPLMNSDGGDFIRGFLFLYFLLFLISFSFQNSLLSDFSVEFAWFAIAFQYPGAGDGLAGAVVEIYLLVALA